MQELKIDIMKQTIGPFRIGQEFPLLADLRDDGASIARTGDAVRIDPYRDVIVVLSILQSDKQLLCRVIHAIIYRESGALLCGKPIAEVSLRALLTTLQDRGVHVLSNVDTEMYLTNGVMLSVYFDGIETIGMGSDTEQFKRGWKTISDRGQIDKLIQMASAADFSVGEESGGVKKAGQDPKIEIDPCPVLIPSGRNANAVVQLNSLLRAYAFTLLSPPLWLRASVATFPHSSFGIQHSSFSISPPPISRLRLYLLPFPGGANALGH